MNLRIKIARLLAPIPAPKTMKVELLKPPAIHNPKLGLMP